MARNSDHLTLMAEKSEHIFILLKGIPLFKGAE
jgi:hypothetical protein